MRTYRTIPNNKPASIIRDKNRETCILIGIAISGDRNVIKKEAEKIQRYTHFAIEIQSVWNLKQRYMIYNIYDIYDIYDIFVNCNWVVTRWQYTFTHKQYIE